MGTMVERYGEPAREPDAASRDAALRFAHAVHESLHDFNNLLVTILGNAALARRHLPPDSPLLRHLDNIETASDRGATVLRNIRVALSEIEADRPGPPA